MFITAVLNAVVKKIVPNTLLESNRGHLVTEIFITLSTVEGFKIGPAESIRYLNTTCARKYFRSIGRILTIKERRK
jgi:hypothetical protein